MQRGARQTDRFAPLVEEKDARDPHRVDDDYIAIVPAGSRGRAARETRIRRLHDDDLVLGNARTQNPPELEQGAGQSHGQGGSLATAKGGAEAASRGSGGDQVGSADDRPQRGVKFLGSTGPQVDQPPSMMWHCPVMNADSSEA